MKNAFKSPYAQTELSQLSNNEVDKVVRITTAIISGLSQKSLTFKEAKEIFVFPDHCAAFSLGLTVTHKGMHTTHDLQGPHTWMISQQIGKTIAVTVENMKALRELAKSAKTGV